MLKLDDPHQLWRRYALALFIVLTLLGVSHMASLRALSGGEEAAAVINISGRQRMLSQRILFLAAESVDREQPGPDPRLADAVALFERSHTALLRGGDLGLSVEGATRRRPVYEAERGGETLDGLTRAFVRDAEMVVEDWWPRNEQAWRRMREVGPTVLLGWLDDAVREFEEQANDGMRLTRTVADATFAMAILIILLEVLLIFWPAQRMVSSTIGRLRESNAALDRARGDAEAARDEARRAMQVRTHFVANMSHELRTPLNGVMGMLDLLQDTGDPEVRDRARTAHASASHLLDLLHDVLDVSRLESGRVVLESIPFSPSRLAADAVRVLAAQAEEKGVELRLEEACAMPEAVAGDPTRLRQVLINLVANAVKFTDHGEVLLRAAHDGERLRFEVADTGIGIAPEVQATLFTPFTQADASTTRRFGGTGLGLAISRQIVEAMGGAIGVESRPGWGSTFRVEVPAAPAEARPAAPPEAPPARRRLRVLVAEDNGVNRKVAEAFLRRLGHEPVCVSDGAQAVDAVRRDERGFDVVLMDVQMPVMDGIEATRAIRALGAPGALPILALTADALEGRREALLGAGMDGHLTKPIRAEALAEALADATWSAPAGEQADLRRASA